MRRQLLQSHVFWIFLFWDDPGLNARSLWIFQVDYTFYKLNGNILIASNEIGCMLPLARIIIMSSRSMPNKEEEPVAPVLKNIYQSNTYRKNLSWTHFDNEPTVQEKQQGKDKQSCIIAFVACLIIPRSN